MLLSLPREIEERRQNRLQFGRRGGHMTVGVQTDSENVTTVGEHLHEYAGQLLPGGENGLGEDVPSKYFLNFFSDFPFLHEPFQPAAGRAYGERRCRHDPTPL